MTRHGKTKVVLGILIAVVLIAAFGAGLYYLENRGTEGRHRADNPVEEKYISVGDHQYMIDHDIETYLLIGTDDSGNENSTDPEKYHGAMADFLMLFVMDKTDGKYGFVQVNRDTMADISIPDEDGDDTWVEEQICTSHWYGRNSEESCENTVEDVSLLLGNIPIDGYYSIHMSDVGKLNHAVGGVTVTIEEDMRKADPAFKKGVTLKLSDEQAEKFVRARLNVGDGDNRSRMKREQIFMEAFNAQAKARIKEDKSFINDLFREMKDDAVTSLAGGDISSIANFIYKAKDQGIRQLDGKATEGKLPGEEEAHAMFYVDEDSIVEVMRTLCGIRGEEID